MGRTVPETRKKRRLSGENVTVGRLLQEVLNLHNDLNSSQDYQSWLMSMGSQHATVLIVQWNIQKRNRLACVQVEGITQRSWQVKQFLCLKMEIR